MKSVPTEPGNSEEYRKFKTLLNRILAVPRAKILEREDDYRFHSANNPSRPGPKRKREIKPSVSPGPGGEPAA
jgi:hypothetical protein